ncbi:hypothetical protein NITHO_210005 [Nitrolancea hollandica Lb]|uniref:Uncharacterized protein n=1 Tax=Nitrolancea hollandica Lb TaxID=1129897 RepID=I4EEY7_9BACT|nr:hypothetical protein NITHO_210005 [Nitrolancea hollandica Lb]
MLTQQIWEEGINLYKLAPLSRNWGRGRGWGPNVYSP